MTSSNSSYVYDLFRRLHFSDFGARTAEVLIVRPFRVLLIVLGAWLLARFLGRATERAVRSLHHRAPARTGHARAEQRTATLATAAKRLVRLVVWVVAGLLILTEVGVNLAPLLAGSAVVGVALGLGAQSLVRDMLAGLFIIGEDQFGVGDVVDVGPATGTVEEVNLRSTRLRGADGTVWWVPNGQIQRVGNTTLGFSRAVVDVPIGWGVDLGRVGEAMKDEAERLAADTDWSGRVIDVPALWGAQAADATGPTMRVVVPTAPGEQFAVGRELRRRVLDRLNADGLRAAPVPPTV